MIYAEYLKLIKNRQTLIFFILWIIVSVFIFYLSKEATINKTIYAILGNDYGYIVYQNFYYKIIYFLTFLLIGLVMNTTITNINNSNIKKRIITLPKDKLEINLSQLFSYHLVFSSIFIIANIVTSIAFFFLLDPNIPVGKLISLTSLLWILNLISLLTVVSFFHIIIGWIKQPIISLIICVFICLFSIICPIKIIPLQWASSLIPNSVTNIEMNYIYLFLCILTIAISYIKLGFRFYKISILLFLFIGISLSGCSDNNKPIANNFSPKQNIVYIAFSLECNICSEELIEINKNSNRLNLQKIEILTLDSEKEVKKFLKTAGIKPTIKVTSIEQESLRSLFGTLSFPQAIIFEKNKKIGIGKGYIKIDTLLLYAKK